MISTPMYPTQPQPMAERIEEPRTRQAADVIAFAPETWNAEQEAFHAAATMEDAMHKASCAAGGWYRRPVTIWMRITRESVHDRYPSEEYQLRPFDAPNPSAEWSRCYTIDAHAGER